MAARNFWSRLFGKGDPDPGQPPESKPDGNAHEADHRSAHDTNPPALTPATDGETRVSGRANNNFTTDKASDVYALALYELATENGSLSQVTVEVEQLAELLAQRSDLIELLSSRALSREDRAGLLDRVFKGRASDTLYKFLHVLNRKGRLASLAGITTSFGRLVAEQAGIVEVDAYVAQRMDASAASDVAKRIGVALGGKQVVLHQYVDQSLIGGLRLRIGDQLIDGSVATQLSRMKRDLIDAGREKARRIAGTE